MKKAALDQVLAACGITGEAAAGAEPARYVDLPVASLVEHAIRRDEGELAAMFCENFEKRYPHLPDSIRNAGPRA